VLTRGAHVIEQNLSVVEAVARKRLPVPRLELPHDVEAERQIEQRLAEAGGGAFAILNPGAGWGAKRWQLCGQHCLAQSGKPNYACAQVAA
jgi:heptosyltransferase-1